MPPDRCAARVPGGLYRHSGRGSMRGDYAPRADVSETDASEVDAVAIARGPTRASPVRRVLRTELRQFLSRPIGGSRAHQAVGADNRRCTAADNGGIPGECRERFTPRTGFCFALGLLNGHARLSSPRTLSAASGYRSAAAEFRLLRDTFEAVLLCIWLLRGFRRLSAKRHRFAVFDMDKVLPFGRHCFSKLESWDVGHESWDVGCGMWE